MVADAEAHRSEDAALRAEVDTRQRAGHRGVSGTADLGRETPAYGARPLRRFIAREVETRVGRALLRGDLPEGGEVFVDLGMGNSS